MLIGDADRTGLIRVESTLVRWEEGMAIFRARLSRLDGAVAEAHGAAHNGEAEDYWRLAEDRARARAAEVLGSLAALQDAGPLSLRSTIASVEDITDSRSEVHNREPIEPALPSAGDFAHGLASGNREGPERHRPTMEDASEPDQSPGMDAPLKRANSHEASVATRPVVDLEPGAISPPDAAEPLRTAAAATADSSRSAIISPAASTGTAAPGDQDAPGEDDPFGELPPRRSQPAVSRPGGFPSAPAVGAAGAKPGTPGESRVAGHIRGEPGGAGHPRPIGAPTGASPATPAGAPAGTNRTPSRTVPTPAATRCSHPGCELPLTAAQVTLSTQKYQQPLCPRHLRERGN